MQFAMVSALGLSVGVLVGLLGIGGGVLLVPAMVYILRYDQHLAQGTSLLILLPPTGLGALREYWRNGQVDVPAGVFCAIGFLLGGHFGGQIAVSLTSRNLLIIFAFFLILSAVLLFRKTVTSATSQLAVGPAGQPQSLPRMFGIMAVAGFCGVAAGLVGIGGGVLIVPMLCLLFGFSQHRAQGTSLISLIPPTGILAFLAYARAGYVSWRTGLVLIPGVFLGGIAGAQAARRLHPTRMRQVFALLVLLLGAWQLFSAWH
jgi:uncharacterized protein